MSVTARIIPLPGKVWWLFPEPERCDYSLVSVSSKLFSPSRVLLCLHGHGGLAVVDDHALGAVPVSGPTFCLDEAFPVRRDGLAVDHTDHVGTTGVTGVTPLGSICEMTASTPSTFWSGL